jgi:hypothetical protein
MKLAEITIETDGGPWAKHNMPCAVCRNRKAVLDMSSGHFKPCWDCQADGWTLEQRRPSWAPWKWKR